ncbi:M48 family metallopeptidase [Albidovulum sp.]|uniref:M48 family metallopeptidase n=1 Tax=Albidovulum sp. TaxID=1872424 RepID=UPI001D78BC8C|nr:M48 family metallopeptidase [Paracoccaceae bacterium]MCC0046759.1 M48 family metallopeptidase [Defluviimonas sp.]HPE24972.1 M48 family metallopeptidase [Albidovulum sp.]MCB2140852.1 M48 family metallopeptidase [Paracoccaceae bacterium]MCB2158192.1 M48 family metallopeptidase [Paracoccaceae bacterium]
MLRLAPILLAVLYGLVLYHFSVWRTRRELDARSRPLDDPALLRAIDRLAEPLGVRQVPVRVYEIDPVNGLAAPDGRIFLTRGFLQKFRAGEVTGEEMASVIAHELGHVALGHARRRMIDFSGQNAIRVVLSAVLGRFLPWVGFYLANFLTGLLAARLSRQDEFEADEWASALLVKAGIGTGPQKSLFAKLGRLTGTEGRRPPVWLASHPDTDARIAAIEANERRWGLAGPGPRA